MRKHFLILMLMALLPLAGWAAEPYNLSSVEAVRAVYPQGMTEIVYNAQPRNGIAWTFEYRAAGSTEWVAIDKDECDIKFFYGNETTPATVVKNAGTYTVSIDAKQGSSVYTSSIPEAKRPSFEIKKFPLEIKADGTEKVYGDADPTTLTWDVVEGQNLPEPKENIAITFSYQRTEPGEAVNAGGYALSCTATATNYDITVTGNPTLKITRAPLTIYYDKQSGTPDYSKNLFATYGQVPATITGESSKVTAVGWKTIGGTTDEAPASWGTVKLTPKAITANVAGSEGDNSTTLMQDKTAHEVEISLSTVIKDESGDEVKYLYGDNYYVVYNNPKLYVKQATIAIPTTAPVVGSYAFTFAKKEHGAFTYNGTSQEAKYTIKYGKVKTVTGTTEFTYTLENDALTLSDDANEADYTVDWKWLALGVTGTANADEHNNVWAGTYNPIIKAVASGNYYTVTDGVELTADEYKYEIAKKSLAVYAADDSKTYDGTAVSLDQNKVQWSGLIAADQTAAATATKVAKDYFELKFVDPTLNTTAPVNQGTYKVKPVAKDAPAVTDEFYTLWNTNYTPQYSQSNFKVTPKTVTIKALEQSIKFGETVAIETVATLGVAASGNTPAVAANIDLGGVIANDTTQMRKYLVLSLAAGTYSEAKTYPKVIAVGRTSDTGLSANDLTAKNTFFANYDIKYEEGDFTILKSTFKMFAKAKDIIYGEDYDLTTDFDFGTLDFEGEIAENAEITYTLENANGETVDHPTDAGSYQINLKLADKDIPAGYDAPEYIKGTFTIKPRPITVTPVAQALQQGAKESDLSTYNTNNAKVKFTYTGDDTKEAIVNKNDVVNYTLVFNVEPAPSSSSPVSSSEEGLIPYNQVEDVSGSTNDEKKLIDAATETSYAKGITVKAGTNANYVITPGTGALTVIGATTLVLDRNDVDLVGKINTAATASAASTPVKYTVMFANRTMKAQKWYAMVLPFETSVSELSKTLGYAVVNVLKDQTDVNKVQFKLHMANIPANTPFLVKVYNSENTTAGANQYGVDLSNTNIKFTQKKIEPVPADGLVTVTDTENGNKFIGTYKAQKWEETSDYRWILNSGAGEEGKFQKCDQDAGKCSALGAYLETAQNLDSFAPAIFVEEPDGSTTAINTITGEQINFVNDAWYTLNGVKLNGMPTEKGVYINNGKKIVIK